MKHFLQQFDDMGDKKRKKWVVQLLKGLTDCTHVICGLYLDPTLNNLPYSIMGCVYIVGFMLT